jgi:hypothetical protein
MSTSPAATVVKLTGQAFAERASGRQQLALNDKVEAGDSLVTEAGASLALRFADNSVITLGPGAQVDVRDFVFGEEEKPALDLGIVHGLVRSASGKIVEQNPEGFKIAAPMATVGIRGTETLHKVEANQEFHHVLVLGKGHTVTISTGDGRSVTIDKADLGVVIQSEDTSPLQPLQLNPAELESLLNLLASDDIQHSLEPSSHLIVSAQTLAELGFTELTLPAGEFTSLDPNDLARELGYPELDEVQLIVFLEDGGGGGGGPNGMVYTFGDITLVDPAPSGFYPGEVVDMVSSTGTNDSITIGNVSLTTTFYATLGAGDIVISGDAGGDLIDSTGGSDTITIGNVSNTGSGNGNIIISGDAGGAMTDSFGGDDDITIGDVSNSGSGYIFVSGDAHSMTNSAGGDDTITTGDLNNTGVSSIDICGDAYSMTNSTGGDDSITVGDVTITGVGGIYIGGDAYDMTDSTGGDDTITIGSVLNDIGYLSISGDSAFMSNSTGGADNITIGKLEGTGVYIYGDAYSATNSVCGNDTIWVKDFGPGTASIYGDYLDDGGGNTHGDDTFKLGSNGMTFFSNGSGAFELHIGDFGSGALDTLNISALFAAFCLEEYSNSSLTWAAWAGTGFYDDGTNAKLELHTTSGANFDLILVGLGGDSGATAALLNLAASTNLSDIQV